MSKISANSKNLGDNEKVLIDITNAGGTPLKMVSRKSSVVKKDATVPEKDALGIRKNPSRRSFLFDDPQIQTACPLIQLDGMKGSSSSQDLRSSNSSTPVKNRRQIIRNHKQNEEIVVTVEKLSSGIKGMRKSTTEGHVPSSAKSLEKASSTKTQASDKKVSKLNSELIAPFKLDNSETRRKSVSKRDLLRSFRSTDIKIHVPSSQELDKQLEQMMLEREFNDIEKAKLRELSNDQKWILIIEYREATKHRIAPRDYISNLKKKPHDTMEHLTFAIKGETPSWIREFIKMGGVPVISKILEDASEKQTKKPKSKYYTLIQNSILVIKALMQQEEGIKAVLNDVNTLELLFSCLDLAFISERTKVVLLHILAAASTLDSDANKKLLSLLEKNQLCFITLSCAINTEVAAAAITCINAIVMSGIHKDAQKDKLRSDLLDKGLGSIVKQWQERKDIPEVLCTQLSVLSKHNNKSDPSSISPDLTAESPLHVVNKLLENVRGTPLCNLFVSILIHLLKINPKDKAALNKWEQVNFFARATSMVPDNKAEDAAEAHENILKHFEQLCSSIQSNELESSPENMNPYGSRESLPEIQSCPLTVSSSIIEPQMVQDDSNSNSFIPPPPGFIPPPPPLPGETPSETISTEVIPPVEEITQTAGNISHPPPPPGFIPPPPGPPPPPGVPAPPGAPLPPGAPPPPGAKKGLGKKEISVRPDVKMRPFFWNKLNLTSLSDTVWEQMKNNIKIPKDLLQLEFAYVENESAVSKDATSTNNECKTLIILDQKRWQNISIMLSKFAIRDYKEIRDAIVNMDEEKLGLERLQLLTPFAPNSNEVERLKPYKEAPPQNLGAPEKFFLVLMEIPNIEERLLCWQYKLNFSQKYSELKEKHECLISACNEIRSSLKFLGVLEVILLFGNFLNCNSSRGGAWGFKLDSLSRLSEMKLKSNPERNMLYLIIGYIQSNYPHLSDFYYDLKSTEKAKEIQQLVSLLGETQILEDGIISLEAFIATPASDCGNFNEYMQSFVPAAKSKLQTLKELYKIGTTEYSELINYFGETKGFPVGTFFEIIHKFITSFESAKFQISKKAAIESRQNLGKLGVKMPTVMSQGTLDKVIEGLKSGQAFQ